MPIHAIDCESGRHDSASASVDGDAIRSPSRYTPLLTTVDSTGATASGGAALTTVRAARECPGCESPSPAERRGSTERERRNSRMLNSFRGKSERRRLLHSKAEADEHTMKLQQNTGSTRAATASVGTRRLATHYSHTSSSLNSYASSRTTPTCYPDCQSTTNRTTSRRTARTGRRKPARRMQLSVSSQRAIRRSTVRRSGPPTTPSPPTSALHAFGTRGRCR